VTVRSPPGDLGCGLLLGAGLGAFIDGILLHQILQWHNMLSSVRPPIDLLSMKYNMLYDGIFHAAAWFVTATGVAQLFRLAKNGGAISGARFGGGLVAGWGLFNAVEGSIDHQLLDLHHVHPGEYQWSWDVGFLLSGVLLLAIGLWWAHSARYRANDDMAA